MPEIEIKCQHCKEILEVPEDMFGETTECPACGGRISIPIQPPKRRLSLQQKPVASNTNAAPVSELDSGNLEKAHGISSFPSSRRPGFRTKEMYIKEVRSSSCYDHLRGVLRLMFFVSIISTILFHFVAIYLWSDIEHEHRTMIIIGLLTTMVGSIVISYAIYQAVQVYIDIGDVTIDTGNKHSRR